MKSFWDFLPFKIKSILSRVTPLALFDSLCLPHQTPLSALLSMLPLKLSSDGALPCTAASLSSVILKVHSCAWNILPSILLDFEELFFFKFNLLKKNIP